MKNNCSYKFYYDEAFHTRKITTKNDVINIYKEDTSDIYVGVFIGFTNDYESEFISKMSEFEKNHKIEYGLSENQELKGTTIGKKNFKFGIASFNDKSLKFYRDYFNLLDENTHIQLSMLSKTCYVVSKVFDKLQPQFRISRPAFIYSITKMLNNYRCNDLYIKLFDSAEKIDVEDIISHLKLYLRELVSKGSTADRKIQEVENYKQLLFILETSQVVLETSEKYTWNYDDVFKGFNSYIRDEKISPNNIELLLDQENNTAESAKRIGRYFSVEECKSHNEMGIRAADILSNFIGRTVWWLTEDLHEPKLKTIKDINSYDFKKRSLLSTNWFDLTLEKYQLYKSLMNVIIVQRNNYWTICNDEFFDYSGLLVSLILYVGGHESYDEFISVALEDHTEYFNEYSSQILSEKFRLLHMC